MEDNLLTILNMNLTASYVIAAIILVRLLLKKAPKTISYALWAVAGFRLVIPFTIESAISLIPSNLPNVAQEMVQSSNIPMISIPIQQETPQNSINTIPVTTSVEIPILLILQYLWLAGIAAMLIYSIISIVLLKRRLRGAVLAEGSIHEAENLKTPFVLGVFKPQIYMPSGLSAEEKRYIIHHEQTHIKRFDHIVKPAAFLLLCVHWFNPLVWLAFMLMSADMEMSCDERVLREMGGDIKKAYSSSLLSLATGRKLINGSPLAFGEGNVKGRIKNVLNFKKPAAWVIVGAVMLAAALGVGLALNRPAPYFSESKNLDDTGVAAPQQVLETVQSHYPDAKVIRYLGEEEINYTNPPSPVDAYIFEIELPDGNSQRAAVSKERRIFCTYSDGRWQVLSGLIKKDGEMKSTGWEDIQTGMSRETVHKIMGESYGMLSGMFGDVYALDDGSSVVFYYDSESVVQSIRRLDAPEAVKWDYTPTRSAVFPALPIWFDLDAETIYITVDGGSLYIHDDTQNPNYIHCGREKTYKQGETVLWSPMAKDTLDHASVATDCSLSFEIRQGGNVVASGIIRIAQVDNNTDGFSSEYMVTLAVADANLMLVQGPYVDGGCVVTERP